MTHGDPLTVVVAVLREGVLPTMLLRKPTLTGLALSALVAVLAQSGASARAVMTPAQPSENSKGPEPVPTGKSAAFVLGQEAAQGFGAKAKNPFPDCMLDVQVDPNYPAGLPILLTIKVTNQGKTPVSYWCGGPRRYPSLGGVEASVVQDGGKPTLTPLSNGQYIMGSGMDLKIEPGESMQIPGVLPSLSKGSYTIKVGDGKSAQVKVTDDPAHLKKCEADLLDGVRKGDPVAQHAASMCRLSSFQKALLQELGNGTSDVIERASQVLIMSRQELPADAAKYVSKAMRQMGPRGSALWNLGTLASRIGTDEMLDAVLDLTRSGRLAPENRGMMVRQLSLFKQEKSKKALRDLLKDSDEVIRFAAAYDLAVFKGGDPEALDVLVATAEDPKSEKRGSACIALASYSAEPRAERAIRSRLEDANRHVRESAASALELLRQARKPR